MKKWFKNKRKESGAITVMTALILTVVIGFTALLSLMILAVKALAAGIRKRKAANLEAKN